MTLKWVWCGKEKEREIYSEEKKQGKNQLQKENSMIIKCIQMENKRCNHYTNISYLKLGNRERTTIIRKTYIYREQKIFKNQREAAICHDIWGEFIFSEQKAI